MPRPKPNMKRAKPASRSSKTRTTPSEQITASELGMILYEEFDVEDWGTVSTDSFRNPPRKEDDDEDHGLYEVLERVAQRLNARE